MRETKSLPITIAPRGNTIRGRDVFISVMIGIFVAHIGSVILHQSYLWACLIAAGLLLSVLSLAVSNFKEYWLMIYAMTLPLDIKKMLIDSDIVRELTNAYGIPLGELPGPVVYLADLPFIVLMAVWFFEIILKNQKIFFPKSNICALAFIGWAGLSLANSSVFVYGFYDFLRTIKFYLLFLYIANNIDSMGMLKTLVKYLLIGMILQGLLCLYQYISQDISHIFGNLFGDQDLYSEESIEKFKDFFNVTANIDRKRASGTVGPINAQAQYFEFILPIAFLLSLGSFKYRQHFLHWLALGIGLGGLVVTFSRGALVGISTGITSVFLIAKRNQMISKQKYITIIIIVLLIAVMLAPAVYSFIMARHEATLARFHLYKVGLDMIRDHPLLGVGLNNHIVLAPYYDPDVYIFPTPTHNHYLFIASEVGIPGLVFFLAFLFISFLRALQNVKTKAVYSATVSLGIVGAFIAIGMHNLVDHLSYHTNLSLVWLLAGLAAAIGRIKLDEPNLMEALT